MPKVFSEEQRELALHALAIYGSPALAHKRLTSAGLDIGERTLYEWRDSHSARLQQIAATVLPNLRDNAARESEELMFLYMEEERKTLEHFGKRRDELTAKDAAGAIKNLSIARGVSTDKANVLRDLPTEIVAHRKADEIGARWRKMGVIDGTAEEIVDEQHALTR